MTQIQILNINRALAGYIELRYKMTFTLPAIWGTGGSPIVGLEKIVAAYPQNFAVEVIPVTGTVVSAIETVSVLSNTTQATIRTQLQNRYTALRAILDALTLDAWDNAAGQSWDGATWTASNLITDNPISVTDQSNLSVTSTGVTGAAVTLTLPAVPGKFHNIAYIEVNAYSTAARTGSATPIVITTTNLSGLPAFTFATAAAIGTTDKQFLQPQQSIKALAANTATTIVCPATTGIIWRVNVFYNLSA